MPMSRAQKDEKIESYGRRLAEDEICVVARYSGMSVAEMTALRGKGRELGVRMEVTKNRLMKRALEGTDKAGIADLFAGPVILASGADPSVAKVLYDFAKKNDKLAILGGAMGASVLDKAGVEQLAKLPTLDELRGQIVGLLVTPARQTMGVLSAPAGSLARVIGAYAKKDA